MKKLFAAAMLLMLVGCSTPTEVVESEDIPVKVGVLTPMSGGFAAWGEETQAILNQTILNNFGEDSKIELVYEDSKCNGQDAVTAYQKLVNVDNVDVILGGLCSTESLAIAPLLEADGKLAISHVSANAKLDGMSSNFMTLSYNSSDMALSIVEEVKASDKIAIISEENDWNIGMLQVMEEELGEKIISNQIFEKGSQDVRNTILKALNSKPEVLILNPNAGPSSGTLFRQLAEVKDSLGDIELVSQLLVYLKDDMREISPELSNKMKIVEAALLDDEDFQNFKSQVGEIVNYTEFLTANTHDALLNLVLAHRRSVVNGTDVVAEVRNNKLQGLVTEGKSFGNDTFLGGVEFSTFVLEDDQIKEL